MLDDQSSTKCLRKLYLIQLAKEQTVSDYTIRRAKFLVSEVMKYIRNTKFNELQIIDLGSGRGLVERYILKNLGYEKHLLIACIDLNIRLLTNSWIGGECERILAFLPWIPIRKKSASIVIMSEVIEHIPRRLIFALLKRVYEILSSNGLLLITTPNTSNYTSKIKALITKKFDLANDPQHLHNFNFKTLKRILEQAGFIVKREHFDIIMDADGILSKFALRIPYRIRKVLLRILPEMDKLVVIKAYKRG